MGINGLLSDFADTVRADLVRSMGRRARVVSRSEQGTGSQTHVTRYSRTAETHATCCRRGVTMFWTAISIVLFVLVGDTPYSAAQFAFAPEATSSAKLPEPPREQRQLLNRAERAINDQEFSAAVEMLTDLLEQPDAEDFFLNSGETPTVRTSIRRRAQQMLGGMPSAGREILELKQGRDAWRGARRRP